MPVYVYSKKELAKYRAKQVDLAAQREQEYQASVAREVASPAHPPVQHHRNQLPHDERKHLYPSSRAPYLPSHVHVQPLQQQHKPQQPLHLQQMQPLHPQQMQPASAAANAKYSNVRSHSSSRAEASGSFAQYYGPNITTPERWMQPPPPRQQARYIPPVSAWPVRYRQEQPYPPSQQQQPHPPSHRAQSLSDIYPDSRHVHAQTAPHFRGDVGGYMHGAHIAPAGNVDFNQAARAPPTSSHYMPYNGQSSMPQHYPVDAAHAYGRPRTTNAVNAVRSPSPSEKQSHIVFAAGMQRRAVTLSSVSPATVHSEYRRPLHQQLFSEMSTTIDAVGLPSPCPPPAPSRGESVVHEPSAGRPYLPANLDNSHSRMEVTTMRSSSRASGNVLSRSSSAEMLNELSLLRSKLSLATAKAASLDTRVNQLESSLQNERDAYQSLMLQHQRLQVDYDKQFAEQRKIAEHSAPESVVIHSIPDERDTSKELEKARAEALHFRSEYEKVVLSSSNLAAKVSHASSDVQSIMEQQTSRFEEQRKKDMQQIDLLKNQKDAMQDRLHFLQSELDGFRESLISSRDTRSRATPPLLQQSPTKNVFIGRSIDLDESSRFVRQVALQQLHSFSNLPGFVGVGIRVKEVLDGGASRTIITEMLPNMSASDSGAINLGDSLVAIDTKPIAGLSLEQIRDLTVGPRGTLVSLNLSRNGRIFTVFLRRGSFSCSHCTVSNEDSDRNEDSGVVDLIPSVSTSETITEFPWISSSTIAHLRNAGLKVFLMATFTAQGPSADAQAPTVASSSVASPSRTGAM